MDHSLAQSLLLLASLAGVAGAGVFVSYRLGHQVSPRSRTARPLPPPPSPSPAPPAP